MQTDETPTGAPGNGTAAAPITWPDSLNENASNRLERLSVECAGLAAILELSSLALKASEADLATVERAVSDARNRMVTFADELEDVINHLGLIAERAESPEAS